MTAPLIQPDVRQPVVELWRDLAHFFPGLTHFYGYAGVPDHNTRRCLDAMVFDSSHKYRPNPAPYSERVALGDAVLAFLKEHAEHYGINGVIWNRKVYGFPHSGGTNNYRGPHGAGRPYTLTAHDDHLHIDIDCRVFKPLRPSEWDGSSYPGIGAFVAGVAHPAVTLLGQRLQAHGWTGYLDGPGPTFGDADRRGVAWFQTRQGWTGTDADGIPGPQTWALLMADPVPVTPVPEPEPVPVPAGVNIRVATWNLRRSSYAADQGTPRDWSRRWALMKAFLSDINGGVPGVLLVQECTQEQQDTLAAWLGVVDVGNGRGGHPGDRAGDNVAVLVGPDYRVRKVVSVSSGGRSPRFMTCVQAERAGELVWFASTHLTAGKGNAALRRDEMAALLTAAAGRGVDLERLVLGGDLNEGTANGARRVAAGRGLVDIKTQLDGSSFPNRDWSTFTGWDPDIEKGTHIDAILIGAKIAARAARIAAVGNGASDHNMLISNLTITEDSP